MLNKIERIIIMVIPLIGMEPGYTNSHKLDATGMAVVAAFMAVLAAQHHLLVL